MSYVCVIEREREFCGPDVGRSEENCMMTSETIETPRGGVSRWMGKAALLGAMAFALASCTSFAPKIDEIDYQIGQKFTGAEVLTWGLQSVDVVIPDEMIVWTDPDTRYPPKTVLNWWGDPPGDRRLQVTTLLTDAIQAGALDALAGNRPVNLRATVREFHAMTPKARASELPFGVHEIKFDLAVVDAVTGEVLVEETGVNADLQAFSGTSAIQAVQTGQTQKVRIQARVAFVIRSWLGSADA